MQRKLIVNLFFGMIAYFYFITTTCVAQEYIQPPIWEFSDKDSNPITVGVLSDIDPEIIKVRDGLGVVHLIETKTLSKPSLQFVKSIETSQKRRSDSLEHAKKLLKKLKSSSSTLKIKTLQRLSKFGTAASFASELIASISTENENKIGVEAFYSFLAICLVDEKMTDLANRIIQKNSAVKLDIKQNPLRYFKLIRRFGILQEDVLIYAAFNGTVAFPPFEPSSLIRAATLFTNSGEKNNVRAMAAYSLAFLGSQKSQDALWSTLSTAEKYLEGQQDTQAIKAIYTGCAEHGWQISAINNHMAFYKKYRNIFKDEAAYWNKLSKTVVSNRLRKERLERSSKMRNFKKPDGSFLARCNIEKVADGQVLVLDHKSERRAINLTQFNDEDIEWIKNTFRQ